jgi:predicted MFS family arabinose efflux permease
VENDDPGGCAFAVVFAGWWWMGIFSLAPLGPWLRSEIQSVQEGTAMSFGIYIIGFLILIGGLIYGAVILHVAAHWIAVGAIVLLGLAILKGVQATRGKDPSG